MSNIQLLPDVGVTFANGVNVKLSKDPNGAQFNMTISLSGGAIDQVIQAVNSVYNTSLASLDIVTTTNDVGKLARAINLAQTAYTLV